MKNVASILRAWLASRTFFYILLAFFVLQALWFVFTSLYPMAFDEEFHVGIIKIYANQWLPFLAQHPEGADAFGAVARDPSYLFHYLMSFPYRVLHGLIGNETTVIILLRLINVAMFAYGLVLFRKVLLRASKSPLLTHGILGIFVLIPIVPQLAAHINYDNLLMVLMAWASLLVLRIIDEFNRRHVNLKTLSTLVLVGLAASLVKYAFLPIFAGIIAFVLWYAFRQFRGHAFGAALGKSWKSLTHWTVFVFATLFLLVGGLFFERYGINTLRYHTPIADCGQVLNYERCSSYGPWIRNHNYAAEKGPVDSNPLAYTVTWIRGLMMRLFFAVSGPTNTYANYPPLPIPYATAYVLFGLGIVGILIFARRIFNQPFMLCILFILVLYCGSLWIEDFGQFLETGEPVAINGRYLVPVLPLAALLAGRPAQLTFRRNTDMKPFIVTGLLLLFLHGGGVFTYILRSDPSWYWPNSAARKANNAARQILDPITIQGSKYY